MAVQTRHAQARMATRKAVALALALTGTYLVVEVLGGIFTRSLALLADAGHMLADVAALSMALAAAWYSTRPATPQRSWGYYRAEVLAALLNGILLVLIAAYIFWEAAHRLAAPPQVKSLPMLAVASVGLAVNAASALILWPQRRRSINVQGAFLHVMGDLLGSVGAITAALVMMTTGWLRADPVISIGIGLVILYSAWGLVRRTTDVLMESTPRHVDMERLRQRVLATPGVKDVHDLHVWTLTTGFVAMSGHVLVDSLPGGVEGQQRLLAELRRQLKQEFGIHHATVQLETSHLPDEDVHCTGDPRCVA